MIGIVPALIFTAASCNRNQVGNQYSDAMVELAGKKINVEIADTNEEKNLGLSGRDSISDDQGMLFTFGEPTTKLVFWMKDMKFAIDVIWIRNDTVIDITRSAMPEPGIADSALTRYRPSGEADSVLELPAGWSDRNNVKIGDQVKIVK